MAAGPDIKRPNMGGNNSGFLLWMVGAVAVGGALLGGAYWYKQGETADEGRRVMVQSGMPADFFGLREEEQAAAAPTALVAPEKAEEAPTPPPPAKPAKKTPKKAARPAAPPAPIVTAEELRQREDEARRAAINAQRRGSMEMRYSDAASGSKAVKWINTQEKWNEARDEASYPMVDRDRIITEASFVPAVLVQAINSELGGKVVAQIEQNIYGAAGRKVLIPAGSKAVGRYQPLRKTGETRINIIWHRIITPDGINIRTQDAEMADGMGRAGITGDVDNHYFERFGIALLVSTLTAVTSYQIPIENQGQAVVIQSYGAGMTSLAQTILNEHINIKPTVTIPAGARILISPQRDIWFPKPKKETVEITSLEAMR